MHRPVSEEVHLSAVAVDYGVVALQGAAWVYGFPDHAAERPACGSPFIVITHAAKSSL